MDAWGRMFRDEQEALSFLLREEFTDMDQSVIRRMQDEAESAYVRLPQPEAAANAQVVMLAEIALQQARMAKALENVVVMLDAIRAQLEGR